MTMTLTQVTTGGVDENINIDSNTLKVDGANNRVGIGTANPTTQLTIGTQNNATIPLRLFSASTSGTIDLVGRNTNNKNVIQFYNSDGTTGQAKIESTQLHTTFTQQLAADLRFGTNNTERIRINSSGNVGIKSIDPLAQLHILNSSGTGGFYISRANGTAIGDQVGTQITTDSSKTRIYSYGDALTFWTAATGGTATERLRVDSSGRLLLGTTTEGIAGADEFTVATSSHTGITIRSGTSSNGNIYFSDATSGNAEYAGYISYNHSTNKLTFGTASTARVTIESSGNLTVGGDPADGNNVGTELTPSGNILAARAGTSNIFSGYNSDNPNSVATSTIKGNGSAFFAGNVGLGETNPVSKLIIKNTSSNDGIRIISSTTGEGFLLFGDTADNNTGGIVYSHTSNALEFLVNNSERMRVDNSGRLLIGASSSVTAGSTAGAMLQVEHSSGHISGAFYCTANTAQGGTLVLGHGRGSATGLLQDSDTLGDIRFAAGDGTDLQTQGARIKAAVDGAPNANDMPTRLVFSTCADGQSSPTERMRITRDGHVWIGDNSPTIGARLALARSGHVQYNRCTGTGTGNIPLILERASDNGTSIEFKRAGSVVGNINVTSTTTNYVTSSDYRLKENVVDLDGAIVRVKQLAPKRFNFTVDADTTVDGFLAHEAQTVVPEAVTGTHNEVDDDDNAVMQGIDQSKLVPLLTAALQEAIAKIETLETKVAALEAAA